MSKKVMLTDILQITIMQGVHGTDDDNDRNLCDDDD